MSNADSPSTLNPATTKSAAVGKAEEAVQLQSLETSMEERLASRFETMFWDMMVAQEARFAQLVAYRKPEAISASAIGPGDNQDFTRDRALRHRGQGARPRPSKPTGTLIRHTGQS